MTAKNSRPFHPVFLEPRDDHWAIHDPERLGMDDQCDFQLVPYRTAELLPTAIHCEDCFPEHD